jgi:VCBS repeat-containing protein
LSNTLSDLAALFFENPVAARGLAATYQALLGGVPTIEGFTYLINTAIETNYGSLRHDIAFNTENVFINLTNSLVHGNAQAAARFDVLTGGASTLVGQIEALYRAFVPEDVRTVEGLAYLTRSDALAYYAAVAAERGVAGEDGAAVVALASLLKILVEHDVFDLGDDVNDLVAAVVDGTARLDNGLTDIDAADGDAHDGDERDIVPPTVIVTAAAASLAPGESMTVSFDFSEEVDGFALTDLVVQGGTVSNLTQSAEDPTLYTATFTAGVTPGAAAVTLSGSYQDLAGNAGEGGTIALTVRSGGTSPGNDAPVATADSYVANEDTVLTVGAAGGLLANDSDTESNPLTAVLVTGPAHGSLTLNADGSFSYTPDENFSGADSFTYKANDGAADGNTVTVALTVNGTNDAPAAIKESFELDEDTTLTVAAPGLLSNDIDPDGDTLTAVLGTGPAHGTLTLNADGSFTYTPDENFSGQDSFTYRASDGSLYSSEETIHVLVKPVNDVPVAVADSYSLNENEALTVSAAGVLANDSDADDDGLTPVLVTGPAHGSLTLNADGSFVYTPDEDFFGEDGFTYKANDGTVDGNTVTVGLTVNEVNAAPVSVADNYTLNEDETLTVAAAGVLANDADGDGDPMTAVLVEGPAHGTLTLNANGSFSYTPDEDFSGEDSFTYKANDGATDGAAVIASLTVNAVNDAPLSVPDGYSVDEDNTLTIAAAGVLANDTDIDGDPLTAALVAGPAHGSLTLNADGSFSYTPDENFFGDDSFTYKSNDGTAESSAVTVDLTVNSVNEVPVGLADSYTVDEDETLTITAAAGVLANDGDVEGDPLTAILVDGPAHGSLTLNADGSFSYTPDENFFGDDSFTYKSNDGTVDGNTVTVALTVNSVNDAPVAIDDNYTVDENESLTITAAGVLANDGDVESDPLTAILVDGPAHGSLTLNGDGSFDYTPDENFSGPDRFTYKVNDGTADGNAVTVNLTVNPVNDAPVAVEDNYTVDEDETLTITAAAGVLVNDSDANDDPLTAVLVSGPANGALTLNADGSFSYTPASNYAGADSFTYMVNDGTADGNTVTVNLTVNGVNDAPVALSDFYQFDEDSTLTTTSPSGVLANDYDLDSAAFTAALVGGPTNGTLTFNADGSFAYTPVAGYHGFDTFTYTVNDGTLDGNTATVYLEVQAVNDTPVAVGDSYAVAEDTMLIVAGPGVLSNDSDPDDGDTLSAVLVAGTSHGTLHLGADGSFVYTPNAGFNGADSFTYKVNDGTTDGNTVTVSLAIGTPTQAPVAVADSYFLSEEGTLAVTAATGVLANDADGNGDSLTAVLVSNVSNGTLSLNADGSFSYTPNANFAGKDSFTYKANDGTVDGNTVTVTLNVANTGIAHPTGIDLDTIAAGIGGFRIAGAHENGSTGFGIASAGDFDGDDRADILVGSLYANPYSHLVFGAQTGASVNLGALGAAGFGIVPQGPTDSAGWSLGSAGDVNGDDHDDFIVGAVYNAGGGTEAGAAYVVFGGTTRPASINLNTIAAGTGGFKITGQDVGDRTGYSVSAAGDIDGDGYGDVIVGAIYSDAGGTNSGAAYVVYGSANPASVNLDNVSPGSGGFRVTGEGANNQAGVDVSSAGDVNGDGYDELLVGAQYNGSGATYVVFGSDERPAAINLSDIAAGIGGFKISGGVSGGGLAGSSVSAGDIDGDGYDDVIVGAPYNNAGGSLSGAAFVVYGSATPTNVNLSGQALGTGFRIIGEAENDWAGYSVSVAGDVNGDGFDDVLVGARSNASGGSNAGAAYLVFGSATRPTDVDLDAIALGIGGFKIVPQDAGDQLGISVSGAGDVNGDGFDDLLVGAFKADANGADSGAAYVIYGGDWLV